MSRLRKGLRHKHGLILTTWLREVRVVLVYKFVYDHRGLMRGYAEEGIEEKTKENEDKASMSIALLGDSTVASQVRCNKRAWFRAPVARWTFVRPLRQGTGPRGACFVSHHWSLLAPSTSRSPRASYCS